MNQKSAAAALVHVQADLIKSGNMKTNQFKVLMQVFFKVSVINSALLPRDKEQAPPSGSCDRRGPARLQTATRGVGVEMVFSPAFTSSRLHLYV